ncbi:DNA-binding response regulator, LytR/AlgR family [Mucilaginibacter gossypiicola]|uniref:DNA-binding response regulator, LytR/AlgR family n=1 Tax=Mucilaginibacter gossypiicola TaxID=551995 RepID=A0A1H8DEQ3_9SPHI|nr:LytTR family DNA-binding domain-containing protein [Mucilaginibacter gossypiicola]SEN05314.1 DNA-binding response regulator, LytR/AlgR family [Mucilaginibacter gossypiicola]
MNLTCYIVDDEYHAVKILRQYIEQTEGLELVGYATNPVTGLNEVTRTDSPALTFLDVDMPELSGMEFAGLASLHTEIIFTTSFPEYAVEAFEKQAFDYLLKPVSYERFLKSIKKAKKAALIRQAPAAAAGEDFFFITTEIKGKMVKIAISDIIYVEAAQNYVRLHLHSGRIMAYLTMTEVSDFLSRYAFSRVHHSFLINDQKIKSVEPGQVTLINDRIINLGRTFKGPFLERMKSLLIRTKRKY